MVKPGYNQKLGKRQAEYYRNARNTLMQHYDRASDPIFKRMAERCMAELNSMAELLDPPEPDLSDL
jgi:hypothetical protein